MDWKEWILILAILFFALYKYGTRNFSYWHGKGIKYTKPWVPFYGDFYPVIFRNKNPLEFGKYIYDYFKGERFGGITIWQSPMLLVRDPDLLKQIMVKDTEYFINRYEWAADIDPLMQKSLFALKDEPWKNLRAVMTNVFTAAKMKDMFTFMDKCGQRSAESVLEQYKNLNSGKEANILTLEIKDYFSRYGTDVIASTAFGVEIDSFKHPDNEFFTAGNAISNSFAGLNGLKIIFMFLCPYLAKKLQLTFFGQKLNDYFVSVVKGNIAYRNEHNIVRKDVIHILMEARKKKESTENWNLIKGKLPDLTDDDIAAQAMLFYFGGFDTMAFLLSFLSYELALNPDIQQTLYEEIERVIQEENGITYEGVMQRMHYFDMVVNEALRKYSPSPMADRKVEKTYTIPKTDTSPELILQPGDVIWIPIIALHRDPEYFPDPEKFNPERFRDEKKDVKQFTFLPFGTGPRNCIAMRYALMEAKTGLVHLLRKFEIVPVKETTIPLKLDTKNFFLIRPINGVWLGLKPRN